MKTIRGASVLFAAAALLCGSAAFAAAPSSADKPYVSAPASTGGSDPSVVAALIRAGGGTTHFSLRTALDAMAGTAWTNAELVKLRTAYGPAAVRTWREVGDYAVTDAARRAHAAPVPGVPVPAAPLTGKALARRVVQLANSPGGYLLSGVMVDVAVAHRIRNAVFADVNAKFGPQNGGQELQISNRLLYDLAHEAGVSNVKLAALH